MSLYETKIVCYVERTNIYYLLKEWIRVTIITLNVEGMSCGNCVKSIESNLRQLSGVEEVQVELAAKTVTVTASSASEQQIADVIEDLGFDVV